MAGRAVGWLETWLLVEPVRVTVRPRALALMIGLLPLGVGVSLLRHGPFVWDTVWAEDGREFLTAAFAGGLSESLNDVYAGYLHVLPRVGAEAASAVGPYWSSTVVTVLAAAIAVAAGFVVYVCSGALVRSGPLRGLLAVIVVLVPTAGGETPNSLAYVPWFLTAASLFVLWWRPAARSSGVAAGGFLGLVALSTPVMLLYLPLAAAQALRAVVRRDAPTGLMIGGYGLGLAVQAFVVATHPSPDPLSLADPAVAEVYLVRVFGAFLPGIGPLRELWAAMDDITAILLAVLALGTGAFIAWATPRIQRVNVALLLALSVGSLVAFEVTRGALATMRWGPHLPNDLSARYAVIPFVALAAALLVTAGSTHRSPSGAIRMGIVALLMFAVGSGFDVDDKRLERRWRPAVLQAQRTCEQAGERHTTVEILPEGWVVRIPCDELL